jgi:chromate reductase
MMGASPGMLGTSRAQYHLRQVCVNVNLLPFQKPEVFVANAGEKFDKQGNLTDDATRKYVRGLLEALAVWTRRLKQE